MTEVNLRGLQRNVEICRETGTFDLYTYTSSVSASIMVAQAPSGKKPLPDMMTSIRIDQDGGVEIVDQLLLP